MRETKQNLSNSKYQQYTGDTLSLSGGTNIFGNLDIQQNAEFNIVASGGTPHNLSISDGGDLLIDGEIYGASGSTIISGGTDYNLFTGYTATTQANLAFISGQTDNKLNISVFNTYTGTTKPTSYQTLPSSTGITMNVNLGINAKCSLSADTTITFTNITNGDEGNIDIIKDTTTGNTRNIVFNHATLPIKIIRSITNSFDLTGSTENIVFSYVCNGDDIKITYGENYG